MAFVKLPSSLRTVEVRRPEGGAARVDFSVFAGEIEQQQRSRKSGAARWGVRSCRQNQTFDFLELPISPERGDVVAVVAAMPSEAKTGPIIAVADVDSDQRVDFLHRETELLKLLSGYDRDYRYARIGFGALAAGVLKGLVLGLIAYLGASFVFGTLNFSLEAPIGETIARLASAGADDVRDAAPGVVAAGSVAALALFHSLAHRWTVNRHRARFQRNLLKAVWSAAGETLGFVQDNANAFRPEREAAVARPERRPEPQIPHRVARRGRKDGVQLPAFLSSGRNGSSGRAVLN